MEPFHSGTLAGIGSFQCKTCDYVVSLAAEDTLYKVKSVARLAGFRSVLTVPMRRDDRIVGVIAVTRAEVGKFADKEVDLLQTFARQAVIAIENVRLFNETTEALEQQKAAGDILSVISSSVADTKPVWTGFQLLAGIAPPLVLP